MILLVILCIPLLLLSLVFPILLPFLMIILFFGLLIGIFSRLGSIRQAMKTPQERKDERLLKTLCFGVIAVPVVMAMLAGKPTVPATSASMVDVSHPFPFPARKP